MISLGSLNVEKSEYLITEATVSVSDSKRFCSLFPMTIYSFNEGDSEEVCLYADIPSSLGRSCLELFNSKKGGLKERSYNSDSKASTEVLSIHLHITG